MKYIVMECHRSYAVVLAEDGRFLTVANLRYEVGQTVTRVVEMLDSPLIIEDYGKEDNSCDNGIATDTFDENDSKRSEVIQLQDKKKQQSVTKRRSRSWMTGLTAMAACMVVAVTSMVTMVNLNRATYGSVYMTINPEVRIDVNRKNVVVGVDGLNADGDLLVEGYSYKKKQLDPVMDELVDRAIEFGYLSDGGQITVSLDAEDVEWVETQSTEIKAHLGEYLTDKIEVVIEIDDSQIQNSESDYGESDYEPIVIEWGDSEYGTEAESSVTVPETPTVEVGESNDGDSGYDDQENSDGDSGYENSDDSDGASSYDDSLYGETEETDGAFEDVYIVPDDGDSVYEVTQEVVEDTHEAADSGYDDSDDRDDDTDSDTDSDDSEIEDSSDSEYGDDSDDD